MLPLAAPAAFGVMPKKNGVYVGDIKSSPFSMHVSLAVGSTGKTARFTYLCGTGRAPTTISGLVVDGKGYFKFASNPITGHDWKLAGPLPHADDRADLAQLDRLRRLEGCGHREAEVSRW